MNDDLSPIPWEADLDLYSPKNIEVELLKALKSAEYYLQSGSKPDAALFKKIKDAIRLAEQNP